MTAPAADRYVAELVRRDLTGFARVRARLQAGAVLRLPVDHHEPADLLAKVQDDLDRLDTATFHREWGL